MHHYGEKVAELVSILPLASDLAGTQPKLAESCTDGKLEELGPFAVVEGKARWDGDEWLFQWKCQSQDDAPCDRKTV